MLVQGRVEAGTPCLAKSRHGLPGRSWSLLLTSEESFSTNSIVLSSLHCNLLDPILKLCRLDPRADEMWLALATIKGSKVVSLLKELREQ